MEIIRNMGKKPKSRTLVILKPKLGRMLHVLALYLSVTTKKTMAMAQNKVATNHGKASLAMLDRVNFSTTFDRDHQKCKDCGVRNGVLEENAQKTSELVKRPLLELVENALGAHAENSDDEVGQADGQVDIVRECVPLDPELEDKNDDAVERGRQADDEHFGRYDQHFFIYHLGTNRKLNKLSFSRFSVGF
ncbi:hypothetical protein BpHYR1_028070 [Brachionus plicatilis]|uniref:Uncharacterized protein n=1 Tax=Brachionus plicatilis TaxID=10195 RepID=A0A3M7R2W2_BRAPC|nr:hypothetical protein BpHYR1_028070 [Brachionus plicatilis]